MYGFHLRASKCKTSSVSLLDWFTSPLVPSLLSTGQTHTEPISGTEQCSGATALGGRECLPNGIELHAVFCVARIALMTPITAWVP